MAITPEFVEGRKKTQFQPGVSGNLAGKPKGSKHLSTYIQEMLTDESFTTEYVEGYTLKKHKGAPIQALIQVAVTKAVAGDTKWAEWLAKYGYGTKLDLTTNGKDIPTPILGHTNVIEGEVVEPDVPTD